MMNGLLICPALAMQCVRGLFIIFIMSLVTASAAVGIVNSGTQSERLSFGVVFVPLILGTAAICFVTAIRLLRGFAIPLGHLLELNGVAHRPTDIATSDDVIEHARRQAKGPAIGLLVTGILNWVTIPLVAWIVSLIMPMMMARGQPGNLLALVPISAMLLGGLMIFAALKMKRLQAYGLAVTASVLAILSSPGNLIGLPIGIWALVVLSQRDVRDALAGSNLHQDWTNGAIGYRKREEGRDSRPGIMSGRLSAHAAACRCCREGLVGMDFRNVDFLHRPCGTDLWAGRSKVRCRKGCHCHLKPGPVCRRGVSRPLSCLPSYRRFIAISAGGQRSSD